MKKQTKVLAVLSTAMFMAAVTPMVFPHTSTAYAKTAGWTEEDGAWRYYDSYGDLVTDSWKKSDNDWYYLDSDGFRATNQQIDEYYVGEDGKRVTSTWISEENEDYWSEYDAPEYLYRYYAKDGKLLTSTWATIGGHTYYFDEDGIMQTGSLFLDGFHYYLGSDGIRRSGWVSLENEDDAIEDEASWYYYDNSGKRIENEVDKKINGAYYTFVDGRMQTGWYKLPAAADATSSEAAAAAPAIAGYQYYDEDGKRASGWRELEGAEGISDDSELYHFYFKNGVPYHAAQGLELFTIDSKRYAFNTKGEMQTGKQAVNTGDGETANYYFGEDGVMKTGKLSIENEDTGDMENWYFQTDGSRKGQGFHGIKDNTLYIEGLRQEADSDLRYEPIEFEGKRYLVNTNGSIQKAASSSRSSARPELEKGFKDFKDENDTIWTVDTEGVVQ